MNKEFLTYLKTIVTESKQKKIEEVITSRTNHVTLILEDLFQDHNISATLRSAEIFGVQNVHIIEQRNNYTINTGIAMGASKWLHVHRHQSTIDALQAAKHMGYTIVATVPSSHAISIEKVPLDNKIALIFGTEYAGLTRDALDYADIAVTIPMFGFTESFNVSVSAALCLQSIINRLHQSSIAWQLSEQEKEALFFEWICKSVKHFEEHKEHFFGGKQ
jgi:tRNA (guanosine-2'-O-)-methyltransferase